MAPAPTETPIRRSILPLIAATAVSLACPALASAQASQGAIGVSATILPAPAALSAPSVTLSVDDHGAAVVRVGRASSNVVRTLTPFVRVIEAGERESGQAFTARPQTLGSAATVRLDAPSAEIKLRLERLIIAGT